MMKFFRKYNKHLIAVFMSLLMIVFVGGSALEGWLTPKRNRTVGESRLGKITELDTIAAKASTTILERVGINWQRLGGTGRNLTEIDWVLLSREAEHFGMARESGAVRSLVEERFFQGESLDHWARSLHVKPDRIVQAFGNLSAITETMDTVAGAAIPSVAELRSMARDALDKVRIKTVLLPAEMFLDDELEFSDSQIQDQFEQYKENKAGEGLDFGYFVDDAVKLQYIKIDRQVLADRIRVIDLESKAKKFYDENRTLDTAFFRPTDEKDEKTMDDPGDRTDEGDESDESESEFSERESSESGTSKEKPSPFLEWEQARDIAINKVRRQEAEKESAQIAGWLVQHLQQDWLDAETGVDGYKKLPKGIDALEVYENALERLPKHLSYPDAMSVATTDFFTKADAENVPGIGLATVPADRGSLQTLAAVAFRTQSVIPEVPQDQGVNRTDYASAFQTFPYWVEDIEGNAYVFRVVGSREQHVPESVDEVYDQVVKDLHRLSAYEEAKARAEGLRGCLGGAGPQETGVSLQEAYESDAELVALKDTFAGRDSGYFEPPPFSRVPQYLASRGRVGDETFISGGIGRIPNDAVDRIFDLEHQTEKTVIVELPKRMAVMVAQWEERIPGRDDEFENLRDQLTQGLLRQRSLQAINNWLDPENIRARNQFDLAEGVSVR